MYFFNGHLTCRSLCFRFLMDRQKCNIQRVLPFTEYKGSVVRRGGAVGTIRNCTFDEKNHEWLLHDLDILSHLLLPLAGPEEFDEEDTDKLPDNLQYLPKDKEREEDPDIRYAVFHFSILLSNYILFFTFIPFIKQNHADGGPRSAGSL